MEDSPSQFALRQWRAQFTNPVSLLVLGAFAALLAIIGPFESSRYLTLVPRFGYWLIMAATTYSVGLLVNTYLARALPGHWSLSVQIGISGALTGIAIAPVVVGLNYATFTILPAADEWPVLLLQFFAISVIISTIFQAIALTREERAFATENTANPPAPRQPALLDRLPLGKRDRLVALSSEDHYTRIRTVKGDELILIRLSDAIREAEPTPGLRVHRSHWVALDAVVSARRDGDRAVLEVAGGTEIPVSRANLAAIKDAGLLPQ